MDDRPNPTLAQVLGVSLKIGLISFGGPAAQIAILQEELVERRRWIDQPSFLRALNFCMLLPGPEAQQLATYLGYRLHGLAGALAAGGLFVLPGAIIMFGLSWLAAAHGQWPPLQAIFKGLLPIVVALVLHAVWRIGKRSLKTYAAWAIAWAALFAVMLKVPFPLVVLAALIAGIVLDRLGVAAGDAGHPDDAAATAPARSSRKTAMVRLAGYTAAFVCLWAAPIALVITFVGPEPFADIAALFSKAAFVTFGGAYAVLPYVSQAAVEQCGWLSPEAMVHGLALAETTPGPLILVTQYIGFFAGWNAGLAGAAGGLSPFAAATIAAGITTWCTFLPSIYLVLAAAPLIETLTHDRRAAAALAGVSSAVVGVIASLGITIGRAAFMGDGEGDPIAILLALGAFGLLVRFKVDPLWLIAGGGLIGVLRWLGGF